MRRRRNIWFSGAFLSFGKLRSTKSQTLLPLSSSILPHKEYVGSRNKKNSKLWFILWQQKTRWGWVGFGHLCNVFIKGEVDWISKIVCKPFITINHSFPSGCLTFTRFPASFTPLALPCCIPFYRGRPGGTNVISSRLKLYSESSKTATTTLIYAQKTSLKCIFHFIF